MSHRKRILLVEDDEQVRYIMSAYLKECGFLVTEAGNGREGLEVFNSDGFDCIITDNNMPVMNGISFVKAIRAISTPIKIVLVSGYLSDDLEREALAAGANIAFGKDDPNFSKALVGILIGD